MTRFLNPLLLIKVFRCLAAISKWYSTAMKDGHVTLEEALQLILKLAGILGLNSDGFNSAISHLLKKD